MTTTNSFPTDLIANCLADIAAAPDGAEIYADPYVPGLAWVLRGEDYDESGSIGRELTDADVPAEILDEHTDADGAVNVWGARMATAAALLRAVEAAR